MKGMFVWRTHRVANCHTVGHPLAMDQVATGSDWLDSVYLSLPAFASNTGSHLISKSGPNESPVTFITWGELFQEENIRFPANRLGLKWLTKAVWWHLCRFRTGQTVYLTCLDWVWSSSRALYKVLLAGSTPRHSDFVGLGVAWALDLNKPSHNSPGNSNVPESLKTVGRDAEVVSNIVNAYKVLRWLPGTQIEDTQ